MGVGQSGLQACLPIACWYAVNSLEALRGGHRVPGVGPLPLPGYGPGLAPLPALLPLARLVVLSVWMRACWIAACLAPPACLPLASCGGASRAWVGWSACAGALPWCPLGSPAPLSLLPPCCTRYVAAAPARSIRGPAPWALLVAQIPRGLSTCGSLVGGACFPAGCPLAGWVSPSFPASPPFSFSFLWRRLCRQPG